MLVKLCTYCQINKQDFNSNLCLHFKYSKSKINIPWSKRAVFGSKRIFEVKLQRKGSVHTKQSLNYILNYAVSFCLKLCGRILYKPNPINAPVALRIISSMSTLRYILWIAKPRNICVISIVTVKANAKQTSSKA